VFETSNEETANNRRRQGWYVVPVYAETDNTPAQYEALARMKE